MGEMIALASGGWTTLLGGALGGLFRLLPEFLKLLDRKNERAHEIEMFDKQLQADKLRGDQALAQAQAQGQITLDAAGLDALKTAIESQGKLTGVWWVDAMNQLMRPVITLQWVIILYPAAMIATWSVLVSEGTTRALALTQVFGVDEKAICAGIINFWFLDRVIRKR